MYVLTNAQMREADFYTINTLGVPSLTLMERAGTALADEAEKITPNGRVVCVCGGGNNGGDGFVCARILSTRGYQVSVVCLAEKFSVDCAKNRDRWLDYGELLKEIPDCDLIVDCLYGTGFHGTLQGADESLVKTMNAMKIKGTRILSADIPSGVCGGNGLVFGEAVRADYTLCIGEYKLAAMLGDGIEYAGERSRADIGIVLPQIGYAEGVTKEMVRACLPVRKRNSHKGTYGKAAIVAGSDLYTGAAWLSASACLRSGVGYATLFVPQEILPYYILKSPEILLKSTNEGGRYAFNEKKARELLDYDAIAIGMGMSVSQDVADCVEYLLLHYEGRLLIDADGINSLAAYKKDVLADLFAKKKCDVLLTPHVKEFSRLTGESVQEIQKSGMESPVRFAKTHKVTVLLKNATTILTDGDHVLLNTTGNSGQAKGGSGDVLSGLIAGLCASGVSALCASVAGAYLAGKAAELGAIEKSEYSLTATDIIDKLGGAFLSVLEN